MDALAGIHLSLEKDFDQIVEARAQNREHLRGRKNVTSCRSPPRELDTLLIKKELKEKRHLEYLRRRSLSPELCGMKPKRRSTSPKTFSMKHFTSSNILHVYTNTATANGHKKMIVPSYSSITAGPSTSTQDGSLWSDQFTVMRHERGHSGMPQVATSVPVMESTQHRAKRDHGITAQKTSIKTIVPTERVRQKVSHHTQTTPPANTRQEKGVQTMSGVATVNESDVQRLAEYLQEALWREEAMKKKLAVLQQSTSELIKSSETLWTARCSEDLLRNKIKALEAQLQVCLQKFPKAGMKKLVVQMEKQKLIYEEKALVALQKATQEKSEALSKAETLQESLITAKAEALKWQSLYEELKLSSGQLRENQHLSNEQLQQLHSQVELSRAREAKLRNEAVSLQLENEKLQYDVCLLEEDNHVLREEIQNLRDGGSESQDIVMQECLTPEDTEPQLMLRRDHQVEEQLRHTQEKLRLKERECEELQMELHAMEQECQSSQARLMQCREELRQISPHRRRQTRCGPRWKMFVFLLLLLAVAGVAMLWLWHPPFREQLEDLYSDIETRIENYLLEMASPQHSGCFRPI